MASRGTDPETERRRLRPTEDDDAPARFLDSLFYASAEIFLFGLPTLVWVMLSGGVKVTFAATAALFALCLGTGLVRTRWRASDREWPDVNLPLAVLRACYYNLALAGPVAVGLALVTDRVVRVEWTSDPLVGPAVVAAALAALLGWSFPTVASAVGRFAGR